MNPKERRAAALAEATKCVCQSRCDSYGDAEDNFADIALLWNWRLGTHIDAQTVGELMILMKLTRLKCTPSHRDSAIDIIGYAACVAGIQEANKTPHQADATPSGE